ncbi:MAG TPA: efflux transporter outer membrane subunit [Thermoanaerobaculia bacterium]|jgi:NodT family efflux transporter outer membrane factor (OMF) lipoprotein|nr:efflux transporter outer membrane subunit [Thermoanaerobaculia bacterium]
MVRISGRASGIACLVGSLAGGLLAGACSVGPKYQTPATPTPASYKELTPETIKETAGWKAAQPKDDALRGSWWEMFGDPELDALEQRVNLSNQNVAAAFNGFLAARAIVKEARAQYFPTVTTSPSINVARQPAVRSVSASGSRVTTYDLPFDASWAPDLWGKVRNTVAGDVAAAQASAADLANVRLTMQAELAVDYFQLRGQDTLKQLLDSTVVAYRESLELTRALYETGIDSDEAVAQAETQLEATEAQATGSGILRAQLEHAIAQLVGEPAPSFSLPAKPLAANPPAVPLGVPSEVLERRPDVAASERLVAQANAQIGVARAAFFPNLTLSATAGFESNSLATWLTWPARFWSLGPALAETLFEGGLRRATVEQFKASYDQTVANYRQTVLTAFQQVEDNLASLRLLTIEVGQQDAAVKSAQRQLKVATDRYRLGIDPYLNVITAQTTVLSNEQAALNLRTLQMTATVQLIEALGGGWSAAELPAPPQLAVK